jgi:rhodanese-related sulfurtransferase
VNRRAFLSTVGVGVAAFPGCLGGPDESSPAGGPDESSPPATTPCRSIGEMQGPKASDDLPDDTSPGDGYPPAFETTPDGCSVDPDSFDTESRDGEDVPLAPVEATYYWYARGEARFVDARGQGQYDTSRVYGAVSSPANNTMPDDPAESWPTDDRIVCYCGCPHHLSSIRAADLMHQGYTDVYVIDEGFFEWADREFPVAGRAVSNRPALRVIEGRVDPRFAGDTAWARHTASDQMEATEIASDGRFSLHLYFSGVTDDAQVTVETPAYRTTAPLGDLTAGVVSA